MANNTPITIHRKDYTSPAYWINTVEMGFDLDPAATRVATRITMQRNAHSPNKDLELLGDGVKLVALRMNGNELSKRAKGGYTIEDGKLRIADAPDDITLEIETLIQPEKNTSMMGLYVSNGNFFTQCEAEGFRKITWFPDRPDVMAKYTVMLRGDKKKYPVLLSNGNLIEQGDLPKGRHYAKWEDPFKKPSYLFALVAGKLVCQEEKFKLKNGRKALLQVWAPGIPASPKMRTSVYSGVPQAVMVSPNTALALRVRASTRGRLPGSGVRALASSRRLMSIWMPASRLAWLNAVVASAITWRMLASTCAGSSSGIMRRSSLMTTLPGITLVLVPPLTIPTFR